MWALRAYLERGHRTRELALLNLGIICARQYARMLRGWVNEAGLDWTAYGTHSLRRTKAALIYRKTKNLRAVQLRLGHSKLESTVRYRGVDVHDALEIPEQTEIWLHVRGPAV